MAEPTSPKTLGLTQAQALFAVLAGGAQARRERVYYRDGVLRSTFYSPLTVSDEAYTTHSMLIETINGEVAYPEDFAASLHTITIEVLLPFIPKPTDLAVTTHSVTITALAQTLPKPSDQATASKSFAIINYDGVYFTPNDTATSAHTIQVTSI